MFLNRVQKIWDARVYVVKTAAWFFDDLAFASNSNCTNFELQEFFHFPKNVHLKALLYIFFSSITLYILFQIRSRRQNKMIEGGYHGLEGGFEARRRGKRGKGRFWVLNAWNFHSAPPILTLPLATFPTASTAASRRTVGQSNQECKETSWIKFVSHVGNLN